MKMAPDGSLFYFLGLRNVGESHPLGQNNLQRRSSTSRNPLFS
jgi:hypothetical protein